MDRLLTVWENLAERERTVLLAFAYRLWNGQRLHGPLTLEKKDWGYEAIEEALDQSVYLTCALVDKAEKALTNAVHAAEEEVKNASPNWYAEGPKTEPELGSGQSRD